MATGFRAGWSWKLATRNLMSNRGRQGSLPADVQNGVKAAVGQDNMPSGERRNYRRTGPLGRQATVKR